MGHGDSAAVKLKPRGETVVTNSLVPADEARAEFGEICTRRGDNNADGLPKATMLRAAGK